MGDAAWALSGLLTLGFFLAGLSAGGALAVGWMVLALGMAVVTVVRFRASRLPADPGD